MPAPNLTVEHGRPLKLSVGAHTFNLKGKMKKMNIIGFRKELEHLINKYSIENGSNTPDFILADYLVECLQVFENAIKRREHSSTPHKVATSSWLTPKKEKSEWI